MKLALVVACAADGLMGRAGGLPWRLPADMRHFQSLTKGRAVVMGRKTYESLYIRPLPDRRNIVLSRNRLFRPRGCELIHCLEQLPALLADEQKICFVIGGAQVFEQFFPHAQRIYQTLVHAHVDGDVWFPAIDPEQWRQEGERRDLPADDKNAHAMSFIQWRRKGAARPLAPNKEK